MNRGEVVRYLIFWGVWLLIPIVWEITTSLISSVAITIKSRKKDEPITYFPMVSIVVPVYNSQNSLGKCLESIADQTYPLDKLDVILVDNGCMDNSFAVYEDFHTNNPHIKIWWYKSGQGKSKALNKGIFASNSKYIVNIDSDGVLDANAILNVATRFEKRPKITCMTGVVLIDPKAVDETENFKLRILQRSEFFEYIETFLTGRNFQSITNTMFTLSGAFSCFRRENLLKTQMYNYETLGEDTHMTFQIRRQKGSRIALCENAFFYTDPIESYDKLYVQRQRWQRAELEVASLYKDLSLGGFLDYFTKFTMRILIYDHTLAFPRLVWYFATIYLYFINYPLELIIGANVLLYFCYSLNCFIQHRTAYLFVREKPDISNYLVKHAYMCFVEPVYRFMVYWMRMAGMINSMKKDANWKTKTFSEEIDEIGKQLDENVKCRKTVMTSIVKFFNKE